MKRLTWVESNVVSVRTSPELDASPPECLFRGDFDPNPPSYDVAPDGQRFLMIVPGELPPVAPLEVLLNWGQELERLFPVAN